MNVDQLIEKLTELRSRVGGDTPVEVVAAETPRSDPTVAVDGAEVWHAEETVIVITA